jgi:excinuclease ABC subunit A
VIYVLDEPSAGLHPADSEALLDALEELKAAGNTVFVVEHDLATLRRADWLVDVGPGAGTEGGRILYSGPPAGIGDAAESRTAVYLLRDEATRIARALRTPTGWLELHDVSRNNLQHLDVKIPLGVFTTITGVSGSGKSSLVSQALVELVRDHLGDENAPAVPVDDDPTGSQGLPVRTTGRLGNGAELVKRLVVVDQRAIGRTPRSNLATYTGLFDPVRRLFAATPEARRRRFDAGRFSFNVGKGRCPTCEGEGFVSVEMMFLPSVFAPCPTCHGDRYDAATLTVTWRGRNIAQVLAMTVAEALRFFEGESAIERSLQLLCEIGLGYLRLGQPATELSGGEAQRIKLATELQRPARSGTLYVLDEPTTGLHPSDVELLLLRLHQLVEAGSSVIVVEHDLDVIADSDWIVDMGPGAGQDGGSIVAQGQPRDIASAAGSVTGRYLRPQLNGQS